MQVADTHMHALSLECSRKLLGHVIMILKLGQLVMKRPHFIE